MILKFIQKHIERLSISDIKLFCEKNNITYQEKELNFAYNYIKNNYPTILKDPNQTLNDIKPNLSKKTYDQVKNIYFDYRKKYQNYL